MGMLKMASYFIFVKRQSVNPRENNAYREFEKTRKIGRGSVCGPNKKRSYYRVLYMR